jgi:nucleoside 2-deoxyribosyltransferase
MKIYLAGFIQGTVIDKCIAWRKQIRDHYDNWKGQGSYGICFLDPLNGEHFNEISPDGLKGSLPSNAIVHKDYHCVKNADLIVCNMDTFGQERPLIGTMFELAWAYEFRKAVVLITDNHVYEQHPFLTNTVSWYVKNVDELLDKKIINTFYKAWNSAKY